MAAMCGQTGRVVAFEPDPYARRLINPIHLRLRDLSAHTGSSGSVPLMRAIAYNTEIVIDRVTTHLVKGPAVSSWNLDGSPGSLARG